jgi:hypothetical protein
MSVSDPGEKIEWGADSELRQNERVPSSDFHCPKITGIEKNNEKYA